LVEVVVVLEVGDVVDVLAVGGPPVVDVVGCTLAGVVGYEADHFCVGFV
jgi:hypothetical protein